MGVMDVMGLEFYCNKNDNHFDFIFKNNASLFCIDSLKIISCQRDGGPLNVEGRIRKPRAVYH